jgi:type II secretion system protein G
VKRGRGFTLIELLIVVAIIAILAAIAIPNLLEAQIRSKISRCVSEIRTMGEALEMYCVDYSRYPPDATQANTDPNLNSFLPRLTKLTTPVSYLTTIQEDIFTKDMMTDNDGGTLCVYEVPWESGQLVHPFTFDYCKKDAEGESKSAWKRISDTPEGVKWSLKAVGPDLHLVVGGVASPAYDPTNGTVSEGDIYFTGPGIGLDKQ